jgi:Fe2+ or Zn2+ uptake regulation protein
MAAIRLTDDQRRILATVADYTDAPSVRQITDRLDHPTYRSAYWSLDQVASSLRRMARRGLVVHDSRRPHRWSLTDAGRAALAED